LEANLVTRNIVGLACEGNRVTPQLSVGSIKRTMLSKLDI